MESQVTDIHPETGWWVLQQGDILERRTEPGHLSWRNDRTHLRDGLRHTGLGRLCLGVEPPTNPFEWPSSPCNTWPISLLKSAIQKAVRRSRVQTVLFLTAQVIRQGRDDFLQLLRHVPIICIKDAVPHSDLEFAVWLMCAMVRGFAPTRAHIERIGRLVADLAACPWRFPRHKATLGELREQPIPQTPLALACLICSCYGGTNTDMRLLRGVPWHFLIHLCPEKQDHPSVLSMEELDSRWYIREAVDFHCVPNMIRDIRRDLAHIGYDKKQIREAIWQCRSSITNKCIYMTHRKTPDPDEYHCNIFNEIREYVEDYSVAYWKRFVKKQPPRKRPRQTLISHFFH